MVYAKGSGVIPGSLGMGYGRQQGGARWYQRWATLVFSCGSYAPQEVHLVRRCRDLWMPVDILSSLTGSSAMVLDMVWKAIVGNSCMEPFYHTALCFRTTLVRRRRLGKTNNTGLLPVRFSLTSSESRWVLKYRRNLGSGVAAGP